MKIDFEMLEKMVDAGATGSVVLAFLKAHHDRKTGRRARDKVRKRDAKVRKGAESAQKPSQSDADAAIVDDTPRARLFREAKPALLTLGIADNRAGGLIVQWLKLTNDDDQLVLATILRAQSLAVAEAPSWILATLKGKTNGNGTNGYRTNTESGSASVIAGVAAAADRRGRERLASRPPSGNADTARDPDFEFRGAADG